MLGSHKLMAFVGVRDAARAKAFYKDTLGLTLIAEDGFALAFEVRGVRLRVTLVKEVQPHPYTALGWDVPDIIESARALEAAGVKLNRYEGLGQDELGIWTAPGGAKIAWFQDPDANILSIAQVEPM